ncbi:MAG: GMC oxidoreductase, partial [Candidatus Competibacteraceae bacterium]|nr:GMC oxidoreductase [Candidatus Competibacteraceae bacterium]
KFGHSLRQQLIDRISRQLLLAFTCELPADPSNQVSIDPQYKDQLQNYRPVISFNISDYCRNGIAYARETSRRIFQRLGVEDHTHYDPSDYGYFTHQGQGYVFRGGNHFAGTHAMGSSKQNSVVDYRQRSWDHDNLYLVGAGSMPSIGSSNTTLTLSALSFLSAKHILDDLKAL